MRACARGVGLLLVAAGLVIGLVVAYDLYGTRISGARAQGALGGDLRERWRHPAAPGRSGEAGRQPGTVDPVAIGTGLAVLRIPRFGRHWTKVVVEGVSLRDLQAGPGHYPGTALPGQVGNFSVAGHRATHDNGFFRMNEMRPGDAVVVETRDRWFTYRVSSTELVDPADLAVIAPVPGRPGVVPSQRMITLTTCDPWYSATHRLIVHGVLASVAPTSAGPPAALAG